VCVDGTCLGTFAPPGCSGCPCSACGAGTTCCTIGAAAICVLGGACPG
jgi:hypothetical protein